MKLHYVTTRYPPHTGGVETHVSELATRMAARGHDVTVHTADRGTAVDGGRLADLEEREGVSIRRHWGVAPGGAFHVAPGVAAAVRASDADLVHAHNYHSLPLSFAALGVATSGRSRGTAQPPAFVVTPHYHGGSASPVRDRLLSLYRPLGGWGLSRADRVIAVSEWERRRLARDFSVDPLVIPNGLDVGRFADATPLDRDRPYLLCVGRLERYKGVQHVVRALPALPEYDLLVAGTGPFREQLERIAAAEGVEDRVELRGFVPDEDLPDLYAGAAAFVTMSGFEAYGMTVAEALAAGTPCVVRRAGALVDWAERADCVGVDLDSVAEGVRRAVELTAPSESLPTWDEVADETERVYASLVERA